jgi:hypothetical protein
VYIYAGKNSFMWFGPTPRVNIMNPEQLKEIFSKIYDFRKTGGNPLSKLLATGLATYEDEKWAKHRKRVCLPSDLSMKVFSFLLSIK